MHTSGCIVFALLLPSLVFLVSCGVVGIDSSREIASELPLVHTQVSVPKENQTPRHETLEPSLSPLVLVSRPTDIEWLLEPMHVVLEDVDARRAIKLIMHGRSLRFDLTMQESLTVSFKSAATDTIHDAMQAICLDADWLCSFEQETLVVKDLETRTLLILAQPGMVEGRLSVNSLGDGLASQFRDGEAVALENVNPYTDELEPLISGLLAVDDAQGVPVQNQLLPRANAVLITARPSTVRKVADVVAHYNERTSKLVRIHLTVFEVTSATKRSIGSRLSAIFAGADAAGSIGWSVRPLNTEGQFRLDLAKPDSAWHGSELLLEWLDSEGDATVNLKDQLDVRNNRIASSSATRTFQYVASITRERDNLGRERTEVKREQLRTGWAISVQPTIGFETVTVRLSLARKALVEERPFAFGDTTGTNFVTDDQNRSMNVTLKDGEARVITLLTSTDERRRRNKLAGLVTRSGFDRHATESVILMRVELI